MIRQTEALAEMIRKAVVIFLLMAVPFLTLEAVGESPTSLATDEESSPLQATLPRSSRGTVSYSCRYVLHFLKFPVILGASHHYFDCQLLATFFFDSLFL